MLPGLSDVATQLESSGFSVVGVEYFGAAESCTRSRAKHRLVGPVLGDSKGEVCKAYAVGDLTVFTFDRHGSVLFRGAADNVRGIAKSLGVEEDTLSLPSDDAETR